MSAKRLKLSALWGCSALAIFCAVGFVVWTSFEGRRVAGSQVASAMGSKAALLVTPASRNLSSGDAGFSSSKASAAEALWPAPSFLGTPVGSVGFAPFVQAASNEGSEEQLWEALGVLEECARIDREIELMHRGRQPNGLDNNLLLQYQSISRACQTIGPTERAMRLPMLKRLAASSAEGSLQYLYALREARLEPSEQVRVLSEVHKWAVRGDWTSALFIAHSPLAASLGLVEQRAFLLALRAAAEGDAEALMRVDHAGIGSPAQKPLVPASVEAQAQARSQVLLARLRSKGRAD